jgi:hypothetical protein
LINFAPKRGRAARRLISGRPRASALALAST